MYIFFIYIMIKSADKKLHTFDYSKKNISK